MRFLGFLAVSSGFGTAQSSRPQVTLCTALAVVRLCSSKDFVRRVPKALAHNTLSVPRPTLAAVDPGGHGPSFVDISKFHFSPHTLWLCCNTWPIICVGLCSASISSNYNLKDSRPHQLTKATLETRASVPFVECVDF